MLAHAGMHAFAASLLSLPADGLANGEGVLPPLGQLLAQPEAAPTNPSRLPGRCTFHQPTLCRRMPDHNLQFIQFFWHMCQQGMIQEHVVLGHQILVTPARFPQSTPLVFISEGHLFREFFLV